MRVYKLEKREEDATKENILQYKEKSKLKTITKKSNKRFKYPKGSIKTILLEMFIMITNFSLK